LCVISDKLPKNHKLGIHAVVQNVCLVILSLAIESAFCPHQTKISTLENLRVKVSVLQNLIRTEQELGIINESNYIRISEKLVEIGKMTNGWLGYLAKKGA